MARRQRHRAAAASRPPGVDEQRARRCACAAGPVRYAGRVPRLAQRLGGGATGAGRRPAAGGQTYSLAAVPPIHIATAGDAHLALAITGYAANDPSDGVELASASITGPPLLRWDAGRLADLCCGTGQSVAPAHGAWVLS